MTIRAARSGTFEGKHRSEFRYGSFQRTLELPLGADTGDVTAECAAGILTIKIGMKAERPDDMTKIQVKAP